MVVEKVTLREALRFAQRLLREDGARRRPLPERIGYVAGVYCAAIAMYLRQQS